MRSAGIVIKKIILINIICISICYNLNAQQKTTVFDKIENYSKTFPKEKLYLTFDKTYYNVGDTVWFKSFLLNGNLKLNTLSDKMYVELYNDSSRLVERKVIALNNGLGYGDFALTSTLSDGNYSIRAYTNWQQNFGVDYYFQKSIYIGNANDKTWLLDSYQKLNNTTATRTLDLKLRISNIKNEPAGLRDVDVYLMNDKKRIMQTNLTTSLNGMIETQIPLSNIKINGNYSFFIVDKKDKKRKVELPITFQDVDEIDLQFMPEGGYMVNGIYGKLAFKAIGADGMGKNIKLKVVNSKNEVLVEASALHKGMGSFYLAPQKDEKYTAIYELNGKEQRQDLPIAKEEGTTLRIDHLSKSDSLLIYVKASETKRSHNAYILVAQSPSQVEMKASLQLANGFANIKLAKKAFPSGVIHFTLFSPDGQPLNERQAFINSPQKIDLNLYSEKQLFSPRDSITIELSANKEDGLPLSGSFAVSVTDNTQVKKDEYEDNIYSYFFLQSEIKGTIEEPSWYFRSNDAATLMALDHLLLTQAWIGYNWDDILTSKIAPKFKPEKENSIEGRLTGLLSKPAAGINLSLLSLGKNVLFTDTLSNSEGKFTFKNLPILDSAAYLIKIKNAKGKTAAANILVDEFTPAKEIVTFKPLKPWYVNTDTSLLNYFKNSEKQNREKEQLRMKLSGNMLKEVEIKGKNVLPVDDATWSAKFLKQITEEELKQTPRKSLYDLLKEQLPGLYISDFWQPSCSVRPKKFFNDYVVGFTPLNTVIIDNIFTRMYAQASGSELFEAHKFMFNYFNAEDVKDIKIFKGCESYIVDIKTRSGNGPWMGRASGVFVYRPLPIYLSKEFYSPKYTVNKDFSIPDLRSTIFWDANVVTDENGKAKISFYAADLPGSYTIKVEGTDMYGRFGYQKSTINIKDKTESK